MRNELLKRIRFADGHTVRGYGEVRAFHSAISPKAALEFDRPIGRIIAALSARSFLAISFEIWSSKAPMHFGKYGLRPMYGGGSNNENDLTVPLLRGGGLALKNEIAYVADFVTEERVESFATALDFETNSGECIPDFWNMLERLCP